MEERKVIDEHTRAYDEYERIRKGALWECKCIVRPAYEEYMRAYKEYLRIRELACEKYLSIEKPAHEEYMRILRGVQAETGH